MDLEVRIEAMETLVTTVMATMIVERRLRPETLAALRAAQLGPAGALPDDGSTRCARVVADLATMVLVMAGTESVPSTLKLVHDADLPVAGTREDAG